MYSFDVFDTLITRTTANPWGIFALMKDRLRIEQKENKLDDYVVDNFFELRIHSEELARKAGEFQYQEEVTLFDIYMAMSVCGCLDKEQIEYLCRVEEETEIANVLGIDKNIRRMKNLLEQGERVVLISDMYLSKDTIRKMLLQIDDVFRDIPLYVSSEYGKRKVRGNLYRQVQELECVSFEEWMHIGDNFHQDIEVPYWLGIGVELFPVVELTDFEKKALRKHEEDSRLQLIIGVALRCEQRKDIYVQEIGAEKAWHIGCRYAGPILYSYAEWIVEQAVKKNIKRLYFIARDGYLVKRIVDIILSVKKIDILTKYIYGSRKAWRMPSLSEEHYNLYQLILWSHAYRITTLQELASVLHISIHDLYKYLPGIYAKDKKNSYISNQELEYIAEKLSKDNDFKTYHLQILSGARRMTQQYLIQEIDTSDGNFAFVDVSGGGLTQGCLRELLKDRYPKPIRTFFFKIDRVNLIENSITDTFMPGFLENNLTIEMMCRAPHGQTKGYFLKDGNIVPELEETESKVLIDYGFYDYEKGILDFAKLMCEISSALSRKIGSMENVLLYLHHVAQEPTTDVLEYFASMPSNESGRGTEIVEYAPKLTEYEIKDIFLRRADEPIELFYKGTDLNYSLMRATGKEKELIDRCKRERNSVWGRLYRQEAEREQKRLSDCYGRAAFYPVRLLNEKIVLYGAGKFGQDLYFRLKEDTEHDVILWIDKKATFWQQKGLSEVKDISEIHRIADIQIVIAVMVEEVADEIRKELEAIGISAERMVWIKPYDYPNALVEWKSKGIG